MSALVRAVSLLSPYRGDAPLRACAGTMKTLFAPVFEFGFDGARGRGYAGVRVLARVAEAASLATRWRDGMLAVARGGWGPMGLWLWACSSLVAG